MQGASGALLLKPDGPCFNAKQAGSRLWSLCFISADQESNDALFSEHQVSLQKS